MIIFFYQMIISFHVSSYSKPVTCVISFHLLPKQSTFHAAACVASWKAVNCALLIHIFLKL